MVRRLIFCQHWDVYGRRHKSLCSQFKAVLCCQCRLPETMNLLLSLHQRKLTRLPQLRQCCAGAVFHFTRICYFAWCILEIHFRKMNRICWNKICLVKDVFLSPVYVASCFKNKKKSGKFCIG